MKFEEISVAEFDAFASTHPLKNYLQCSKMDPVSKATGWENVYYVGIRRDNALVGAARLIALKNKANQYYFSAPSGPLLDFNDKELVAFFTTEIKKFVKSKKGFELNMNPLVIHKERNIDGDIVPDGENNGTLVDYLKELGYRHNGFITQYDYTKDVRWVFMLDLEGKDEQTIFKEMKQNHRNIIKKTEKFCIEIKELGYDELGEFKKITEDTSKRRNFEDRTLEYYQSAYKQFIEDDQIKYLVAYLNVEAYIEKMQNELNKEEEKYKRNFEKNPDSGKTKELGVLVNSLTKRLKEAEELRADGEMIPLSAAMFIMYGDEITYMFSGSYDKYMNFYAQYAIQWYMIRWGIKHDYKRYNFRGITGCFDKKDPEYGVYEFKKGFNGYVCEYIGDFMLTTSVFNTILKIAKKVKG